MDTDFCAMLRLANYMEASFNYGYGAVGREDAFLFTPESDPKLAPKHCNAAYRNILKAVFLSAPFLAVAVLIAGVLGSHSIRKFAATLARGMGATADEVDIRGCWKARLSGRVVDAYISPEQPWIDAGVAEKLCMGAPIAYKLHPDAKRVTPDWLIEHVVPRTHAFYDGVNDISLHLALPLLWAALDESWEERMEPPVRVRIQDAYERIKADLPGGVNPVVKVPLSIWTHNTKLHINEIEPMDTGGGGGTAGGTTGTTGQASTCQVANQSGQVTAMQTQQQVRTNEEILTRIIAQHNQLQQLIAQEGRTHDNTAAVLRGWLETWLGAELRKLNGNICRIAVQPLRMATPDQVDDTALTAYDKALAKYRARIAAVPAQDDQPAQMAVDFDITACLKTFVGSRTTEVAQFNQVEGLKVSQKPRKIECHKWEDDYLVAVEAAEWLRGTHPVPEGVALLRHYLDSYPANWVTVYEKIHGKTLDDKEMGDVTSFMHDRAVEADSAASRNQQHQKATVAKGKPSSRTAKHYKGSIGKHRPNTTEGGRLADDAPCPIHLNSNHTWKDCWSNAYNPNSKAKTGNRNNKPSNKKPSGGDHNHQQDEHHAVGDDVEVVEPGFQNSSGKTQATRRINHNRSSTHNLLHLQASTPTWM
ncbi:unknown protein [Seminavis robusta]|uniref:Uncharacterized protein n=1 Tax=Seminavis robusta TaxID=568900 RepID=A0A9N8HFT2_9STRA|nr:unknown protein [Seminavis robusta]|eukprot:Sro591_g171960.1 n/a (646) ;mRNA; r:6760-9003